MNKYVILLVLAFFPVRDLYFQNQGIGVESNSAIGEALNAEFEGIGDDLLQGGGFTVEREVCTKFPNPSFNLRAWCLHKPLGSWRRSTYCPVLKRGDVSYYALSYLDNRDSLAIIACDSRNTVLNIWERRGTKYLTKIGINTSRQTVTFYGYSGHIEMTWKELIIAPDEPDVKSTDSTVYYSSQNLFPRVFDFGGYAWGDSNDIHGPLLSGHLRNAVSLMSDSLSFLAAQDYAEKVGLSWFRYRVKDSVLAIIAFSPPTKQDSNYNANVRNLIDSAMARYEIMKGLKKCTDFKQVIAFAGKHNLPFYARDTLFFSMDSTKTGKKRTFNAMSDCGGEGEPPCIDDQKKEVCASWNHFLVNLLNANLHRCEVGVTTRILCDQGLSLSYDGLECKQIIVVDIPSDLTINPSSDQRFTVSNLDGLIATITNAESAKFYVPDGRGFVPNREPLEAYYKQKGQNMPASAVGKKCSQLTIKDKDNRVLNFPLFSIKDWDRKLDGKNLLDPEWLMVNANWFDVLGVNNFMYNCPCTAINGYYVSNGTVLSQASVEDKNNDGTTCKLDAFIVSGSGSSQTINIVPNDEVQNFSNVKQAIGGFVILKNKKIQRNLCKSAKKDASGARTALGLKTENGRKTLFVVVIQSGPNSPGLNLLQLAQYMKFNLGCSEAINLDNSGSSQMLYRHASGDLIHTVPGDQDPNGKKTFRPIPGIIVISPK